MESIAFGRSMPGLLPLTMAVPSCGATAVVTNVSDPTRRWTGSFAKRDRLATFGQFQVERFSGVPPLRPLNCAAVAIVTYRRLVTIAVRLDTTRFDHKGSQEFHQLLMEVLRDFLRGTAAGE